MIMHSAWQVNFIKKRKPSKRKKYVDKLANANNNDINWCLLHTNLPLPQIQEFFYIGSTGYMNTKYIISRQEKPIFILTIKVRD